MGHLFDLFDIEPVKGTDITIGNNFPEVFVSETDQVFCYSGEYLSKDDSENEERLEQPLCLIGKHSTDDSISGNIAGFYRIMDGCIVLDKYVDDGFHNNRLYKRINAGVRFHHPNSCYAVIVDHMEHDDLTRAVFGLTCYELETVLEAYANIMSTYNPYVTYPRLTRSIQNENYCDITELCIPEQFPYVTFKDSPYDFSHVSLWGFYRHIQLLTGCRKNSLFSEAFLKYDVPEELLSRIFNIGRDIYYQTKVTKSMRKKF